MSATSLELGVSRQRLISSSRSLIFFVVFYLYLWLRVDLRFISGSGGTVTNFPVFFKGGTFLQSFLSYPGGPVEYLSAFLSQFFYIGWAGALVVTAQAWLICASVGYIFKTMNSPALRPLCFVPAILILVTYTQYTYHFVTTTAFLAALAFVCLYLRLAEVRKWSSDAGLSTSDLGRLFSVVLFLVLSVILYYVAGAAYLLFAVLCAMYELLFKKRYLPGLLYLLSIIAVPYVEGMMFFGSSIVNVFSDLLPFSWKILSLESRRELIAVVYALYLFAPSAILISWFWKTIRAGKQIAERRSHSSVVHRLSFIARPLPSAVCSFALSVIVFAAVFISHDTKKRGLLGVQYYACHRMWPEVLRAAGQRPESPLVVNAVNRALYHTGRLGYDMFSWPQHPDALILTGQDRLLTCWHKFDTQLDLGLLNMAQKNLVECMEVFGAQPMILQRLALIDMVKANYGSARIYLGALSKTLFHAAWANNYLAKLQSDPNLSTDERIQHLRAVRMEKDYPSVFFPRERMLCDLLEKNNKNRMAFEYLSAWYMLNRQLEKSIGNLERLSDFDYRELPPLYEEVVLIYAYGTKKPVRLASYQPKREARLRIEQFSQVFNRYGRNKPAAFDELARDYGDSYFFYHIYGISGVRK
ncbi:MAG: DUF6057 family protein [Planctomycetota bacterium]